MAINTYVVISIVTRLIAIILPIIFVIPRQIKEIKRPNYGYSPLRLGLFWLVIIWIIFLITSLPYMATRLYNPSNLNLRELTTLIVSILGLIKSSLWVGIYTILSKGRTRE